MTTPLQEEIVLLTGRDRAVAHSFFAHRHPNVTPKFHTEIISLVHSPATRVVVMAFRGAAKSTLVEEAIIIGALLQDFRNCIIIGENAERAKDRLRAIKHELSNNDDLIAVFGNQEGITWQESKIILANGVCIQAHGQGQSLRGAKHLDVRPDYAFVDDLESADTVNTREAREKLGTWFYGDFLPALGPGARVRVAATPLDPDALAVKLTVSPEWTSKVYPIVYRDDAGRERPTWPDRFPLHDAERIKLELFRAGKTALWEQEYMCRAVDPATRIFTQDLLRAEPRVRTWESVYAVYDPARTTNRTSASTGLCVGSWTNNRLVIWEASANMWKPDEIIQSMFEIDDKYSPIAIGVEEDGLHEFIMQPLRHAQVERAHLLPIRPLKAPKGKLDFIRGLQPFFKAREVIFAGERQDFEDTFAQFLSFPTGRIDVPNAMAYLPVIRPGAPVYEGFTHAEHVDVELPIPAKDPLFLAVNTDGSTTTAVLLTSARGRLVILADWVRDTDAGSSLREILDECRFLTARAFIVYAPPSHFTGYASTGLKAAARSATAELRKGGQDQDGRAELRRLMEHSTRGLPSFKCSTRATWALRALAGGYARPPGKEQPREGAYRTLMEGVEAFAATLRLTLNQDGASTIKYDTTPDGRRFISMRA